MIPDYRTLVDAIRDLRNKRFEILALLETIRELRSRRAVILSERVYGVAVGARKNPGHGVSSIAVLLTHARVPGVVDPAPDETDDRDQPGDRAAGGVLRARERIRARTRAAGARI